MVASARPRDEIIAGFRLIDDLHQGSTSWVFRGQRITDGQVCILKLLASETPASAEVARFHREFQLTRSFDSPGVVQALDLRKLDSRWVMTFQDIRGESFERTLCSGRIRLAPRDLLLLMIRACEALAHVHEKSIVHKDMNPANLIWNPKTGQVQIIDFGIATALTQEQTFAVNPSSIEGTLAYISPEQTGRMNRALDYRSDLYSLGVTFYQLVAERLPFSTTAPMEMIHCHIARSPIPVDQINPQVPKTLADIIAKLMAKAAEDRYQSAAGVAADLRQCLETWNQPRAFRLAAQDRPSTFAIPDKLYGREREVSALLSAFERAAHGKAEVAIVRGPSGIGKTALVRELHKPLVQWHGFLVSGKFDQFRRDIPYEPLVQALRELIRTLLATEADERALWHRAIQEAMGENAHVVASLIPELADIVGATTETRLLSSGEAQHRFHYALERFIRVFATREHPLALFVDDLQWADTASLKLLEVLATAQDQALLLLLSFRDNEVDETHPASATLRKLQQQGIAFTLIDVGPLQVDAVSMLLADTLREPPEHVAALAKICKSKTGGNPFFLSQFLQMQHDLGHIAFQWKSGRWSWNGDAIEHMPVSDNVVDLVIRNLDRLQAPAVQALAYAACLGSIFDLYTLAGALNTQPATAATQLWEGLRAGFVVPLSSDYRLVGADGQYTPNVLYRFVHDRVQNAAYQMLDDAMRQRIHLHLGRLLYRNLRDDSLFAVVAHYNAGASLVTDIDERLAMVHLNVRAAERANATASYGPALRFVELGLSLLGPSPWQQHSQLTLALWTQGATAAHLDGRLETLRAYFDAIAAHAGSPLEQVSAHIAMIKALVERGQLGDAIALGRSFLVKLGVTFPAKIGQHHLIWDFIKSKRALNAVGIDRVLELPEMTDPLQIARLQIMEAMSTAAFYSDSNLLGMIVFRQVQIALKYGCSPNSAIAFISFSLVLAGALGDPATAYDVACMSLEMVQRRNYRSVLARVQHLRYSVLGGWRDPVKRYLDKGLEAFHIGFAVGDIEFACHAPVNRVFIYAMARPDLGTFLEEMLPYRRVLQKHEQFAALTWMNIFCQWLANLSGRSPEPSSLDGGFLEASEQETLARLRSLHDNTALISFYMVKIILYTIHNNFEAAVAMDRESIPYRDGGSAVAPIYPFARVFAGLALLAKETQPGSKSARAAVRAVRPILRYLRKVAELGPENYSTGHLLIQAEIARILGHAGPARALYVQAIEAARRGELLGFEAICHERYGRFLRSAGEADYGIYCLKQAYSLYEIWGAKSKVDLLDKELPELQRAVALPASPSTTITTTTSRGFGEELDVASILRALQAISQQLDFELLMSDLMRITIENAGAERGVLFLQDGGQLWSHVEGWTSGTDIETIVERQSIESQSQRCCTMIVQLVTRTQEALICEDARSEGEFVRDPYIAARQCRSIACLPVLQQGTLLGVLYLENNLVNGAFTNSRVQVLTALASQAAISISNVRYVEEVRRRSKLENELAAAHAIQAALLPAAPPPPGLAIATHYQPAAETSGDWFHYHYDAANQRFYLQIGDVTGHGMPSALVTGAACGSILGTYPLLERMGNQSIENCLIVLAKAANRAVINTAARKGLWMTMSLICIDLQTHRAALINAGHVPMLLQSGTRAMPLTTKGNPLGLSEQEFTVYPFELAPGDRLFLYTDGLIENIQSAGKRFKLRDLSRLLQESATVQEGKERIISATAALLGTDPGPGEDDCTFVLLQRDLTSP